jgi:lipid-A-disaccharide synthase
MSQPPLVFLLAGEASGDQLGASLMASLRDIQDVRFVGVGGPAMQAQGLHSLFPMEELSILGVLGIIRQLPQLLRRLKLTVQTIQRMRPDAVVTIDAPEFSFRVMKRLHRLPQRPRLIHYVAPTVWAWRSGRARKVARFLDHMLCLYPCEPPYFEKYGLTSSFVGHPIAHESLGKAKRDPDLVCVLPGSRSSEIETLLPIFKETITLLKKEFPALKVVIPTLPSVLGLVQQGTQDWPCDVQIVLGDDARKHAFQKASAALAASGTVALQLSAARLPFVIAYKLGTVNTWIARALLKTQWVCMVNILLNKTCIPELLQKNCTPEKLASAVGTLLKSSDARVRQERAMEAAISLLKAPPDAAANAVVSELTRQSN